MTKYPFCSVIVLNYYGEKIIEGTLNSLLALNYPQNKYEIIVVDNNSKDRSREILTAYSNNYKQIKTIFLDKNLGFSKGNNKGIKKAKGKFVALINNDCTADKNWLKELAIVACSDKKIFAVGSKVLLYPKFISIKFYNDFGLSPVYAWLSKSKLYSDSKSQLVYLSIGKRPVSSAYTYEYYEIKVPYDLNNDKIIEFSVLFNARGLRIKKEIDSNNFIRFLNKAVKIDKITHNEDDIECRMSLKVSALGMQGKGLDKIQNAGIMIFQDGYGRDIGAIVRYHQQHYEFDQGQYNKKREVYAVCGAAVLYNKQIMEEIGYLDENFFMYYEDLDISERARLLGYKIIYAPKAIVRHRHAASSKEWSSFFIYHAERGRLLHVFYNFPFRIFLKEYIGLVLNSFFQMMSIFFRFRSFIYKVTTKRMEDQEPKFVRRIQIIKALAYFVFNFPALFFRRIGYMKKTKRGVVEENYLKILKGEWYFS